MPRPVAVVEPIGCAPDDTTVNVIRPTVTTITMLLFMLEALQIRNKETELDRDWFGLAAWLPIAASACGDVRAYSRTCAVSVTPASSRASRPRQPTRSGSKAPQTSAAWARPRCSTAGVRGAALLPGANQFAHRAVRPIDLSWASVHVYLNRLPLDTRVAIAPTCSTICGCVLTLCLSSAVNNQSLAPLFYSCARVKLSVYGHSPNRS